MADNKDSDGNDDKWSKPIFKEDSELSHRDDQSHGHKPPASPEKPKSPENESE